MVRLTGKILLKGSLKMKSINSSASEHERISNPDGKIDDLWSQKLTTKISASNLKHTRIKTRAEKYNGYDLRCVPSSAPVLIRADLL
jgi:hypothetical protein